MYFQCTISFLFSLLIFHL